MPETKNERIHNKNSVKRFYELELDTHFKLLEDFYKIHGDMSVTTRDYRMKFLILLLRGMASLKMRYRAHLLTHGFTVTYREESYLNMREGF